MNVLFVCNQNQNRSKTAEEMFSKRFNTESAGLFNNEISKDQLEWADVVCVMEDWQRGELAKRFPKEYMEKKIISLKVPDVYRYNQPELKDILKEKVSSSI